MQSLRVQWEQVSIWWRFIPRWLFEARWRWEAAALGRGCSLCRCLQGLNAFLHRLVLEHGHTRLTALRQLLQVIGQARPVGNYNSGVPLERAFQPLSVSLMDARCHNRIVHHQPQLIISALFSHLCLRLCACPLVDVALADLYLEFLLRTCLCIFKYFIV